MLPPTTLNDDGAWDSVVLTFPHAPLLQSSTWGHFTVDQTVPITLP